MLIIILSLLAGAVFIALMWVYVYNYIKRYNDRIDNTVKRLGYKNLRQMEKANRKARTFSEMFFGEPDIPDTRSKRRSAPKPKAEKSPRRRKKSQPRPSARKKGPKRGRKSSSSSGRNAAPVTGGRKTSGRKPAGKRNIRKPSSRRSSSRRK